MIAKEDPPWRTTIPSRLICCQPDSGAGGRVSAQAHVPATPSPKTATKIRTRLRRALTMRLGQRHRDLEDLSCRRRREDLRRGLGADIAYCVSKGVLLGVRPSGDVQLVD